MRLITDDALAIVTIFQEASGEPMEGKIAVGEVIRNRAALRYQSDGTIAGTVLRPFQFSGWNSTRDPNISALRIRSVQMDDGAWLIKECAEAWVWSRDSHLVDAAVLYLNPAAVANLPAWADPKKLITKIGHHEFYAG